ncbi:MAG: P-loop NTPase fold protein [Nitrospinae bacterium]|nr:P-loop NTPase fold protein [Nitrospinota bacterium]
MRIQPHEIEVPENDPFNNDLLGRRETVQVLTSIVSSIEGPCVLSVDAAWGAGKTTFLKMWAQHLRNEGFPVVEFNAWETDFSEEPFIALSTELTEGLNQECKKCADASLKESLQKKVDEVKGKAKEVARSLIPGIIKAAAAGVPLVGGVVGESLVALVEEKLNAYEEARKSVKTFRSSLQNTASTLAESKEGRPLVVMIDELDRSRPSYAVELLEVAKHIFAVDHVVFVLGVNRSELAHSVNALYGDGFDATGYLGRFFDLDFRLPKPGRDSFIGALMKETGINDCLERLRDRYKPEDASKEEEDVLNLLQAFFVTPDLSLRQVGQSIHRLGLVFASLREEQPLFARMTIVMFILRVLDLELYQRFIDGEASDLEVADAVFNLPGIKDLRRTDVGDQFEATLIVAIHDKASPEIRSQIGNSEILRELHNRRSPSRHDEMRQLAYDILQENERLYGTKMVGFKESVRRIELLSTILTEEVQSFLKYKATLNQAFGLVEAQASPKDTP